MKYWYLIILHLLPLISYSQIRDKNWVVGAYPSLIDFSKNEEPRRIMEGVSVPVIFSDGSSCISDEKGNIALLCNGFILYDTLGNIIENGDTIVPQKLSDKYFGHSNWTQQSIILPKQNNQYYVITTALSDSAFDRAESNNGFWFDLLTYHLVEAYGGGKGKVLEKGNILMKDAVLSHNRMTAVKHANGRDWWLVKPHQKEHIFYNFLVTPNGIEGPFEQKIDKPAIEYPNNPKLASVFGSSSFSRDGSYYAHTVAGLGGGGVSIVLTDVQDA